MLSGISLLNRKANLVDVSVPMRDGIASYKVYISNSLDNSYNPANSVNIFDVDAGKVFRSPSFHRKKTEMQMGSNRGLTRFIFDPMDYYDPTANTPSDEQQIYLRVQEVNMAGVALDLSAIVIVPPPNFYRFPSGAITMRSDAVKNQANVAAGSLPDRTDMHIIVPNYVNFFRIHCDNTSAHGNDLLYSPNAGMPYVRIKNDDILSIYGNANNELFLASADSSNDSVADIFLTVSLDPV